ncbi:ABC transporter substrate-binding protein [Paenibacillus filicis]|uniref:ABC transporter substrate-binding protein n=1 Tax=Paenibacillus filicis TaxID=669464 RepID=A0ABU9DFU7_9BACL
MNRRTQWMTLAVTVLLLLAGCGEGAQSEKGKGAESSGASEAKPKGGTLNVGYPTQPITLDAQTSQNTAVKDITRPIYEPLVTLDKDAKAVPLLADSYQVSEDKLTYSFILRKGVKFHNGKELKAEDAVASLNRWLNRANIAKTNLGGAAASQKDDYTLELKLKTPFLLTPDILADPAQPAVIYPKTSIDEAGSGEIKTFVGTGPFELGEWKQNQYIRLNKFKDYAARSEPASGAGGKREALVDEIYFRFVTDESTRLAGIASGEYDLAFNISFDNVAQVENTPGIKAFPTHGGIINLYYNTVDGLFKDPKARQGLNAALNSEEILKTAFRDKRFYTATSSLVLPQHTDWASDKGKEAYNQNNPEKAKQLLKEAGYDGKELRIFTTRDYADQYNVAVVVQQQLEKIGIKVKLEVYDWATLQTKLTDTKSWDINPLNYAYRPTFLQYGFWGGTSGFPRNDQVQQLFDKIKLASSTKDIRAEVDQVHEFVWSYLPFSIIGQTEQITAISDKVKGFQNVVGPIFWNISVTR